MCMGILRMSLSYRGALYASIPSKFPRFRIPCLCQYSSSHVATSGSATGIMDHAKEATMLTKNIAGGVRNFPESTEMRAALQRFIRLQLLALGIQSLPDGADSVDTQLNRNLLANYRQKTRMLKDYPCPVDAAIEDFLNGLCRQNKLPADVRLPRTALTLSTAGLARELSLPRDGSTFANPLLKSYRLCNGVLHNPRSDRRTTK